MFLGYIHTFRAIAIYFIIAMHCIDVFQWENNKNLERILRISISNGTILFVFIAGYLFQHLSSRFQYKKYLFAKFRNVITPYFFISIPAIIVFTLILKRESVWQGFYDDPVWLQVLNFYLTGLHLAPFWFIPVITIYYLVSPALIQADKSSVFYYLLPILILVSCLVGRGGQPLISFVHFLSVYSLGMFCSRYKMYLNDWLSKGFVIIIVFIFVILLWLCEYFFAKTTYTYFNFLQKIVLCFFVLGVLVRYGEKATHHYLNLVADTSFGIFFIHSYVLTAGKMLAHKFFGYLPSGTFQWYFLTTLITMLVCLGIVYAIKIILGPKSRMFVGS